MQVRVSPSVAVVHGEAGVGKSRLVNEAVNDPHLVGRRILWGHCTLVSPPFSYGPFVEALSTAAHRHDVLRDPLVAVLRGYLPELDFGPTGATDDGVSDASIARHRVARAFAALLGAAPTVCIIEISTGPTQAPSRCSTYWWPIHRTPSAWS